jgi:hypothetical protein
MPVTPDPQSCEEPALYTRAKDYNESLQVLGSFNPDPNGNDTTVEFGTLDDQGAFTPDRDANVIVTVYRVKKATFDKVFLTVTIKGATAGGIRFVKVTQTVQPQPLYGVSEGEIFTVAVP